MTEPVAQGVALVVLLAVSDDVVEIDTETDRVTVAPRVVSGVRDPQKDGAALTDTEVLRVGASIVGEIDDEDDTESVSATTVIVAVALLHTERVTANTVTVEERAGESVDDCVKTDESVYWGLTVASTDCVVDAHIVGESEKVGEDDGERLLRGDAVGDGDKDEGAVAECESVTAAVVDPVDDIAGLLLILELVVVDAVGLFDADVEAVVELDAVRTDEAEIAAVGDALPVAVEEIDARKEEADDALGVPVDDALVLKALLREPAVVGDGENVVVGVPKFEAVYDALGEKDAVARADVEAASLALFESVCFEDELAKLLVLTLALVDDVRVLERLAAADRVVEIEDVVELEAAALLLASADVLAVVDGLFDNVGADDAVAANDRDAESVVCEL